MTPSKGCATCGQPVTPRVGKGPPFKYCDEHAPARRGVIRRWYDAGGRESVREYHRRRFGHRPKREYDCVSCGAHVRGYVDDRCDPCRQHERARVVRGATWREPFVCVGCGKTVEASSRRWATQPGRRRYCDVGCQRRDRDRRRVTDPAWLARRRERRALRQVFGLVGTGIPLDAVVPPGLIELARLQLQLKREIRRASHGQERT